jgi:hypothetical protein
VGQAVDVSQIDSYSDFSTFTGTRQGLYVKGTSDAWFDLYIYRDAYTPILAECPANQYGTSRRYTRQGYVLDNIHVNDWAMYAGVEFGNSEYEKQPDSLAITASCASSGGVVEVWLDSLYSNSKIAECNISNTGGWDTYKTFITKILMPVSGNHDVYLKFRGTGTDRLFSLQWLTFIAKSNHETSVGELPSAILPSEYRLLNNYPNPFNPVTRIKYSVPETGYITIKVYDLMGREVATIFDGVQQAGNYTAILDGSNLTSGIYFYRMEANGFMETKKLVLLK